MFVKNQLIKPVQAGEGVIRKLLAAEGSLMMTEVCFQKGAVGVIHSHPHEQVSYIVAGSFEFNLNGTKQVMHIGDSVYIPTKIPHGVVALEENSIILDIFTPQREDFLLNEDRRTL
ncbi:cupin domain-containing protein [Peribacillus sp. NPDC097675]|uniref:cupin domain-containing protein n=1 Tax=Peribacillus sp. NPDC097675 TaxID=3390618 RepID=UPI003CFBC3DD